MYTTFDVTVPSSFGDHTPFEYPASYTAVPSNTGLSSPYDNPEWTSSLNLTFFPALYVIVSCCLKYTFKTKLPSPAIFPVVTLFAFSSYIYPSDVGVLSPLESVIVVSVVPSHSLTLVAVVGYSPCCW